ncbi:hypothetical protein BKA64DRAFT_638402 [Cadophora sp. MPI-SDFR-AT-0126]|nr:hypothetical protein BKA64DRAFT_638402 [Leotiomycetes sp. MPI-SDFR-AT-0126]
MPRTKLPSSPTPKGSKDMGASSNDTNKNPILNKVIESKVFKPSTAKATSTTKKTESGGKKVSKKARSKAKAKGDDSKAKDNVAKPPPIKNPVPLPACHNADVLPRPPLAAETNMELAAVGFDLDDTGRALLNKMYAGKPSIPRNSWAFETKNNKKWKGRNMGTKRREYLQWLIDLVVLKHRRELVYHDFIAIADAFNRKWRYEWEDGTGNYLGSGWHNLDSVLLKGRAGRHEHWVEILASASR